MTSVRIGDTSFRVADGRVLITDHGVADSGLTLSVDLKSFLAFARLAAGIVEWYQVVAGDQLRSARDGKYYPVTAATKLANGYQIQIDTGSKKLVIQRPTDEEPHAVVKRGPDGRAVDSFVHVFSSGES